ncbi:D(2) dopamine receptor isoform X2 [Callithrix jacchus]|uniref:D(2) dopamine receptor isoform X2 n=1 Tax=Callithrix jacchus TaxID=9483 RepID=UPI00159D82A9|nr:D(2) dopamine receptor isoform X2 [Callithrix jacchus]
MEESPTPSYPPRPGSAQEVQLVRWGAGVGPVSGAGPGAPPSRAPRAQAPRSCPASVPIRQPTAAPRRLRAVPALPPAPLPAPPRPAPPRRGRSTAPRGPEPAERLPAGALSGAAGPGARDPPRRVAAPDGCRRAGRAWMRWELEASSSRRRLCLGAPYGLKVVGEWKFSRIHCDIFVTLDVMMCTASILNLCAISIDRYTAVAMPMLYNTRYSSKRRVTVMIAIVWVLSFTISCPLLFGLNNTDQNECIIANPAFVVYSSIVSFYVPFIVTLLVYIKIYIVLRRRRKRVNTKRSSRAFRAHLRAPLKEAARRAQELEMEMLSSTSPPERTRYSPIPPSHHQLTLPDPSHHGLHSTTDSPAKPEKNGHARNHPRIAKFFEIQTMPNGKTRTSLKTISRRKLSQQKEKKATQMLAIVLGVFIICWLPFFITHILNIHCDCNIPPVLYSAFTWLGYVNSAVNPIIYTTFNIEFRKAFLKILHC